MSCLENTRISQNLYLREAPTRKYAPRCLPYCPPIIPECYPCYIEDDCSCCCHCCCCYCHCYNVCCEPSPRLHFSYDKDLPNKDLPNKYLQNNYLNPKRKEDNKIQNSQNQGQNEEQKVYIRKY